MRRVKDYISYSSRVLNPWCLRFPPINVVTSHMIFSLSVFSEKGLKGRINFNTVNNAQTRKHFRYLFLLDNQAKIKDGERLKRYPSNMLMNELELSYRWNSGWHYKKMISRFVLKLIYHNSWFGQFFYFKISIKRSTRDMFCRLESFVRGILQKLSIGLK